MRHQDAFFQDRRNALLKAHSGDSFSNVLTQHALVMIDASRPDQSKSSYVLRGKQLGHVQNNWVRTIGHVLPSVDADTDDTYHNAVYDAIEYGTDTLMTTLVEGTKLNCRELGSSLAQIHTHLSSRAQREAPWIKECLMEYVGELQNLFQKNPKSESYHVASRRTLASARMLGEQLDRVVFLTPD